MEESRIRLASNEQEAWDMVMNIPDDEITPLLMLKWTSQLHPIVQVVFRIIGYQNVGVDQLSSFRNMVREYNTENMTADMYHEMIETSPSSDEDPVLVPFMAWMQ